MIRNVTPDARATTARFPNFPALTFSSPACMYMYECVYVKCGWVCMCECVCRNKTVRNVSIVHSLRKHKTKPSSYFSSRRLPHDLQLSVSVLCVYVYVCVLRQSFAFFRQLFSGPAEKIACKICMY